MNKLTCIVAAFLLSSFVAIGADQPEIIRIDPPHWWVGMQDTTLQLCIYGKEISSWDVTAQYPGVRIDKITKPDNPDFLFIDLVLSRNVIAGNCNLVFSKGKLIKKYPFSLLAREKTNTGQAGFDSRDFIYMLMPDRFSNGDTTNDFSKRARETEINRDSIFYRHGGDIQGVINHLDHIKSTGATALWLTPVVENDQMKDSYHGYAVTDHYKVEPRFGNQQLYQQMVKDAHGTGLKVIMDMVYNHVGESHWFHLHSPMKDWFHITDTFFQTNYRLTSLMDPHASEFDKNKMSNGWFVKHMPDLNQKNPLVARYLVQNSIWWIETTGVDGFRFDTYAYSDLDFMRQLLQSIKREYPRFGLVGEVWDHAVPFQAWLTQGSNIKGAPETLLPGVTDFQLYFAINEALNKPMDWTGGLSKIYYTLAQDFLYSNPSRNLIFLDNHDLSRFYSVIGEDLRKFKMGIGFLLTTRGIPCIYYGTEILMKNFADPDGKVREDFPGGWKSDKTDKFKEEGRTKAEKEAYNYVQKLARIRQSEPALQFGKLTQFVPEKDTYAYFRTNAQSSILVIMYTGAKDGMLDWGRYSEMLSGFPKGLDLMTKEEISTSSPLTLQPNSIRIIKLKP